MGPLVVCRKNWDRVLTTKKLPDMASMLLDLGENRISYVVLERYGSHHVHGSWPSLRAHYLCFVFIPLIVLRNMAMPRNCLEARQLCDIADSPLKAGGDQRPPRGNNITRSQAAMMKGATHGARAGREGSPHGAASI